MLEPRQRAATNRPCREMFTVQMNILRPWYLRPLTPLSSCFCVEIGFRVKAQWLRYWSFRLLTTCHYDKSRGKRIFPLLNFLDWHWIFKIRTLREQMMWLLLIPEGLSWTWESPSLQHPGSFPLSTMSFTYSSDDKNAGTDTFQGNEQFKMLPV